MIRLRKMVLLSLLGAGLVSGLFSCKSDQGPIDLKINFKPGDKYLYATQVGQKINSANSTMDQTMLMEMIYSATGDEAGNKKLNITYDHIVINLMTPAGPVGYDSRSNQAKDPGMSFMDSLIGKSFSISVAPNGDIVKVEGLADLIKSFSSADEDTRNSLESQFSDTAVRLMMQNSFDLYPGKPVKTGDTWTKKSVMGFSGINVNVDYTYTLKSVTDGKATVDVLSVMKLNPTEMAAGNPADSAKMTMQMDGKQDGSMEIEVATGRILNGKTKQTINGKVVVGDQAIPMSIIGDITISSKKL